jgi:hypothetical protein
MVSILESNIHHSHCCDNLKVFFMFLSMLLFVECSLFQAQDDKRDGALSLEDLLPNEPVHPISYDSLIILLGMYNLQVSRFWHHIFLKYVKHGAFLFQLIF